MNFISELSYSSGVCPEQECNTKLLFPSYEKSVECTCCGRRHNTEQLVEKKAITSPKELLNVIRTLFSQAHRDKGDQIVKGISDYQCKLLSPFLTTHGMKDKKAVPLLELSQSSVFDCSKLSDRAFCIEQSELGVEGYGRDRSGSVNYLRGTLDLLASCSNGEERLVPLHVDGDGHCLVHAISRCLVGRELFWHPLRTNLQAHLEQNLPSYKSLCSEFFDEADWPNIIKEAGPDYAPEDGQPMGLTNIHLFGLANVLKRPIILLDSVTGMQSSGDYAGIFLPILHDPAHCVSKDNSLNQPIVIGWSSGGRNHYIPLVAIKDRPLPRIPPDIQPKVWGVSQDQASSYLRYDSDGFIEVAGGKSMSDKYLKQLVDCMDELFYQENKVKPSLVSDVNRNVYRSCGYIALPRDVIATTLEALQEQCLWRCVTCSMLTLLQASWFRPGGELYTLAKDEYSPLKDGHHYMFPLYNVIAQYCEETDTFVPFNVTCKGCQGKSVRKVRPDNTIVYENLDRTATPTTNNQCGCGYKHYWEGKEYDNLPVKIPLSLSWKGRLVTMEAYWFQYETSDPSLNSNAYDVARELINKHFPGDFGEDQLVHRVVETILAATATKAAEEPLPHTDAIAPDNSNVGMVGPHKMIITGPKGKTLHKEELTLSQAEKDIHHRIKTNAPQQQRHASNKLAAKTTSQATASSNPTHTTQDTTGKHKTHSQDTSSISQDTSKPASEKKAKPSLLRIKVTLSDNSKQATLTIDASVTFGQLQEAIEHELSVPPEQQRLRCGFPPKELHPPSEPTQPLNLANGDRVLVDVIPNESEQTEKGAELEAALNDESSSQSTSSEVEEAATNQLKMLQSILMGQQTDMWPMAQHKPSMFREGGEVYEMAREGFGDSFKDGTHFKLPMFPDKVFRINKIDRCLQLCLGAEHIPVRPLSDLEKEKSYAVAHPDENTRVIMISGNDEAATSGVSLLGGYSGAVNRRPQQKAFSGKGHTLSSGSDARKDTITRAAIKLLDDRIDQLNEEEGMLKSSLHENHGNQEQGDDVKDKLMSKLHKVQQEIKDLKNEKLKFEQTSSPR